MTGAGILNSSAAAWKMEAEQPRHEPRRSVIESKSSQPAFPGQPPPLQVIDVKITRLFVILPNSLIQCNLEIV